MQAAAPSTRPNPSRILVAYDHSPCAKEALEAAVAMAHESGARLLLVYVVKPATGAGGDYCSSLERLDECHLRSAEAALSEVRRSLPGSIESEQVVRFGDPGAEILAIASEWRAELIVMGRRGHGRIFQLLVGTTTAAVTRDAKCPVTVVSGREACGADAMSGAAEQTVGSRAM